MPDSFIELPDEIKKLKYPGEGRPQVIRTIPVGGVDFGINLLPLDGSDQMTIEFGKQMYQLTRNMRPAELYYDKKQERNEKTGRIARLVSNIANNESALTTAVDNLDGLPDRIAVASNRVDNLQGDLDSLVNRQVDIGEQLASLTRGVDTKSDELIEDLIGERHYLNAQKEYFERRVRKAIQQLNTLNNRKITNEELIKSLTKVIEDDTERRISDMWGTFAVCSVLKFFDDRVQDFVKKQEPTASITAGIKEVGQWMLEE